MCLHGQRGQYYWNICSQIMDVQRGPIFNFLTWSIFDRICHISLYVQWLDSGLSVCLSIDLTVDFPSVCLHFGVSNSRGCEQSICLLFDLTVYCFVCPWIYLTGACLSVTLYFWVSISRVSGQSVYFFTDLIVYCVCVSSFFWVATSWVYGQSVFVNILSWHWTACLSFNWHDCELPVSLWQTESPTDRQTTLKSFKRGTDCTDTMETENRGDTQSTVKWF